MPRIAVILPAFDEADRIAATLRSISSYRARLGVDWPVVVADDGSTDGTSAVAIAAAADLQLPIQILRYAHRGKALTVRDAMLVTARLPDLDYCMMLDADDELRIDQLDNVTWATGPSIYIGRRVSETNGAIGARPPILRRVMSAGMRAGSSLLLGLRFPDTQCGFKLFPASLVPDLFAQQRSAGWVFDAELLVIAHRVSGVPVAEVPVTWSPRGQSKVTMVAAARSVFALLAVALRYRAGRYHRISGTASALVP
ncbi:MAG TPA: glycosyltransferase, partial [Candidatus Acidoferrum sp.]|nr:glycosyltransferase [Candidatus Acidoferrum sp.]